MNAKNNLNGGLLLHRSELPVDQVSSTLRIALIIGPMLAAMGIAWVAIYGTTLGGFILLVGLFICIGAIHRYGRCGAELPIHGKEP